MNQMITHESAHARAHARGQLRDACDECGGLGYVSVRTLHSSYEDDCLACGGTGFLTGPCECGGHGALVPDLAVLSDGTAPGAVLLCEDCATSCCECDAPSALSDQATKEQLCVDCWEDRAGD